MVDASWPSLEAKARRLAGIKGYVTNLAACPDANHGELRDRDSIEAHLSAIVPHVGSGAITDLNSPGISGAPWPKVKFT